MASEDRKSHQNYSYVTGNFSTTSLSSLPLANPVRFEPSNSASIPPNTSTTSQSSSFPLNSTQRSVFIQSPFNPSAISPMDASLTFKSYFSKMRSSSTLHTDQNPMTNSHVLPPVPLPIPYPNLTPQGTHSKPKRRHSFNQNTPAKTIFGILDVHILTASLLQDLNPYGPQDVYAKLICGNLNVLNPAVLRTRVIKGAGSSPVFNQKLQVAIPSDVDELRIEIWMASHNRGSSADQILGFTAIPCTTHDFLAQETSKRQCHTFTLFDNKDRKIVRGEMNVALCFHSTNHAMACSSKSLAAFSAVEIPATVRLNPMVDSKFGTERKENGGKRRASESKVEQMSTPKLLGFDLADALQILVEERAAAYFSSPPLSTSNPPLSKHSLPETPVSNLCSQTPSLVNAYAFTELRSVPQLNYNERNSKTVDFSHACVSQEKSTGGLNRVIDDDVWKEATWEAVDFDCLAGEFSCSSDATRADSVSSEDLEEVSTNSQRVGGEQCHYPQSIPNIKNTNNKFNAHFCNLKTEESGDGNSKKENQLSKLGKLKNQNASIECNGEEERKTTKKRSFLDMKESDYYLKCDFSREILASQSKMNEFKLDFLPRLIQNQEKSKSNPVLSLQQQFELKQLHKQCPIVSLGSA